ncbi:N-acyl amino acid synthase FeeM domain-containing protein [Streptomyces sp. NBC_01190]|uniref:N-acyl amino acid synthase FeeM domain-containing protein n=1 Tax=Streptomyces sp. NBC_01190 TaxID=2903767 RepID=UPI003866B786|nr:hypothetical protein OG519_23000 [Streptomyces sp. NBC_01190]
MATRLTLEIAGPQAPEAMAAVRSIRQIMYKSRLGIEPSSWQEEDARDCSGWVFLLRDDGRPVGTFRLTPVSSPLLEMRDLGILPPWAEAEPALCEAARLAALPSTDGPRYMVVLLSAIANWMLAHTGMTDYIAYCRPLALRLFTEIGGRPVGSAFHIPERTADTYRVIVGSMRDVAVHWNPEIGPELPPLPSRDGLAFPARPEMRLVR